MTNTKDIEQQIVELEALNKATLEAFEKDWQRDGDCLSCGWHDSWITHSDFNLHDLTHGDASIKLECVNKDLDDDEKESHRGVTVYLEETNKARQRAMMQLIRTLHAENRELQQTFDMRWKADMRAIKKWQEQTGEELVWPDHADLCVWLLAENQKKDEQLRVAREALEKLLNTEDDVLDIRGLESGINAAPKLIARYEEAKEYAKEALKQLSEEL